MWKIPTRKQTKGDDQCSFIPHSSLSHLRYHPGKSLKVKYTHRTKLSIIFSVTKAYKNLSLLSPDHTEIFRACIWKVCLDAAKIIEVRMILFWATEDTKCHSWIFSIFLNVNFPLIVCTEQKTVLANKHNAKWKNEACPMNNWKRYIICSLHWFLWKPKFFDNFWKGQYLNNSCVNF